MKSEILQNANVEKQFFLSKRDIAKAMLIAILTPVFVFIQDSIKAGQFEFQWTDLGIAAVGGFCSYVLKNFLAPTHTVIQGNLKEE